MSLMRHRLCWWCNKKLSAIGEACVEIQPRQYVLVHKICESAVRAEYKLVTASVRDTIAKGESE